MDWLTQIAIPRPVGTPENAKVANLVESYLKELGYAIRKLPFRCKVWEAEESFLTAGGKTVPLAVSPYSQGFEGQRRAVVVENLEELDRAACEDRILILTDELTKEPLQPKDYPFYYTDEHNAVIDRLEAKKPCAVLTVTGPSQTCGLYPFPVIEDGNFPIPAASLDNETFSQIEAAVRRGPSELSIRSKNREAVAYQPIASKKVPGAKGTIVLCAHMDTKYGTPGALDNASGVATLLYAAKNLANDRYDIEIVPFNSEEYYDPQGELLYLREIEETGKTVSLLINVDTVGRAGSRIAVASFHFGERERQALNQILSRRADAVEGPPWYAGDHAPFVFGGTRCLLISASDLFEGCLPRTHCPKDTPDAVDEALLLSAADLICEVVNSFE